MRRARTVLGAATLAAATGCIRGTVPARELYRIELPATAPATPAAAPGAPLGGSLAVMPYDAPGVYAQANVVYRTDAVQYGSYPSREWAVPLGVMLGDLTEHALRARPLTREPAVYDPPSRRQHSFVWRGRVREFDEVDRGGQVFAAVGLEATLARAEDDSVLWTGGVRLERAVAAPTMPNIVRTLSDLASEGIGALLDSAAAGARGLPARVARPAR